MLNIIAGKEKHFSISIELYSFGGLVDSISELEHFRGPLLFFQIGLRFFQVQVFNLLVGSKEIQKLPQS